MSIPQGNDAQVADVALLLRPHEGLSAVALQELVKGALMEAGILEDSRTDSQKRTWRARLAELQEAGGRKPELVAAYRLGASGWAAGRVR